MVERKSEIDQSTLDPLPINQGTILCVSGSPDTAGLDPYHESMPQAAFGRGGGL